MAPGPIELKLSRRRLDRQAADVLRDQILSGRFAPGLRLVEATLAEQLGVSRGTVRAALSELAYEGLVSQVAYTKWLVPEFSAEDAWELYTLRGSLEGFAAKLAAERRTPDTLAMLNAAFARLAATVATGRRSAAAAADLALHKTIVTMTGHRRLIAQYMLLEQQVRHYIVSSNAQLGSLDAIVGEHEPIVRAIAAGDVERAERLARDHNVPEVRKLVADLEAAALSGALAPSSHGRPRRAAARRRS